MKLSELVCPRCQAANRPGATVVKLEEHGRACCIVCSFEGLLEKFAPKENR